MLLDIGKSPKPTKLRTDTEYEPGIPVRHRNIRFNTRVLCTYRHIYGIRAKMCLANSGLYREARHFTAWTKERTVETYYLEESARNATGQKT